MDRTLLPRVFPPFYMPNEGHGHGCINLYALEGYQHTRGIGPVAVGEEYQVALIRWKGGLFGKNHYINVGARPRILGS